MSATFTYLRCIYWRCVFQIMKIYYFVEKKFLLPKAGRLKCIQHFIKHCKFCMLDEMLDTFEMSEIYKKIQKEEKNLVWWCWMKFDCHQIFHPIFSARSKEASEFRSLFFVLHAFEAVAGYLKTYFFFSQISHIACGKDNFSIETFLKISCKNLKLWETGQQKTTF